MGQANEAPEKIWVHELSAKELNVPLKEYHIEYVRADAFIEKADKFISTFFHPDDTELINTVLKEFHEYIKRS